MGGREFKPLKRGWCLRSETFRAELLAAAGARVGRSYYGAERQETGEAKAQRLVREGLQALGRAEKELPRRRKGDKGKVKLARQLRKNKIRGATQVQNQKLEPTRRNSRKT